MRLLIFLLFLLPLSLIGQVESQFNGTLNVFSGSRIGSTNTFTISGIFNSTTTSYTSSQSDTGDIVQVQSGARFYWLHIYSIASNSGGVITCNVRDSSSTLTTFPLGKWSIFRPTPNLRLPLSPDGETNASRSSTFNTLALRVDEIQTSVASATNCEQTFTKNNHGFRKWTPIYWTGSTYVRPPYDSLVPDYIVVDSLTANTFTVANCGTYATTLANGLYWFTSASPGYSLTADTVKVPIFQVIDSVLFFQPLIGFNLMANEGGGVSSSVLADTAAAIRNDFPSSVNIYNSDGMITVPREIGLGGSNGDYLTIDGTPNNKALDLYLTGTGTYVNDSYFKVSSEKTDGKNNQGELSWSHYIYGPGNMDYSISNISSATRNATGNTGSFYDLDLRRASGTFISKHKMQIDSLSRLYNFLEYKSDSVSGGGRKHISGFAYKTQTSGQNVIIAPTKSWLLQTNFYNSSTKFDWLRVDNLDTDTTSNRLSFYNNKYVFPNARPSATASAVSSLIWTAGTPSFLRSQHGVSTGTTDGSGDLTVTFAAAMPDITYTGLVTSTTTGTVAGTVHTKATGTMKVRFYNPLSGGACTGCAVSLDYEVKDY